MPTSTTPFHLVFAMDEGGLIGLGSTLNSLLSNCHRPAELYLNFLCSNLKETQRGEVRLLLKETKFTGTHRFIDYDAASVFGKLPAFFTNYASYGRLLISELLDVDRALYLDTDLLITTDILDLQNVDLGDQLLGAVKGGTTETTYDRPFFEINGYPDKQPYFNAGVLLLNLRAWRERDISTRWREIAFQQPELLLSHDQTVLNAVCAGQFLELPAKYNINASAECQVPNSQEGILHFVGAPKPWDISGKFLHGSYPHWLAYHPRNWQESKKGVNRLSLNRFWQIRRSIFRQLFNRFRRYGIG